MIVPPFFTCLATTAGSAAAARDVRSGPTPPVPSAPWQEAQLAANTVLPAESSPASDELDPAVAAVEPAGASLDVAGASLDVAGASLDVAGAGLERAGASVDVTGSADPPPIGAALPSPVPGTPVEPSNTGTVVCGSVGSAGEYETANPITMTRTSTPSAAPKIHGRSAFLTCLLLRRLRHDCSGCGHHLHPPRHWPVASVCDLDLTDFLAPYPARRVR